MSHDATNWAIKQRGLKPATKIVLWHLCDRHNPDLGCYPSQDRLAHDCELSRSTLNEHLKLLEGLGLIRREQRIDPATKQQLSTRYFLAFEAGFESAQDVGGPSPETGHGAESGNQPNPCPENAESRVRKPDTNLVSEPVREPPRAQARSGEEDFNILWQVWHDGHRPDSRDAALKVFLRLSPDDREKALSGAIPYCKAMAWRKKPRRMIPYLREKLYRDYFDEPEINKDGRFVTRPGRPEWSAWLASVRKKYGERGAQSMAKGEIYQTDRRWPEDHQPAFALSV